MSHRIVRGIAAIALLLLVMPATGEAAKKKSQFYISVGDSYAVGYQPNVGRATNKGFADQIPGFAKKRGWNLKLVNFGCGGATTTSLLKQKGCKKPARAIANAAPYTKTQADAVVDFLKKNKKKTGLITVSISGNDVTKCAKDANPVPCVQTAITGINTNLSTLVTRFRQAAGPKVRIVGTTYPDVILGEWAKGTQAGMDLAKLSQVAFKSLINPALKKQYESVGGQFVDVTKATGGYDSLDGQTTTVPGIEPYSILPIPVANICNLTWYCEKGDIHARTNGYRVIAKLVAATLPKK